MNHIDQSIFSQNFGSIIQYKDVDQKFQIFIPEKSVILKLNQVALQSNDTSNQFDVVLARNKEFIGELALDKVKIIILEEVSDNIIGFYRVNHIYYNSNFLPFKMVSHNTNHGDIGLFGKLGYVSDINNVITDGSELCSISLHAPSSLVIETEKELIITGYVSPTCKESPIFYFQVDNFLIGTISGAGTKTDGIKIMPGKHTLTINCSTSRWGHSVWLFSDTSIPDLKYFKIDIQHTGRGLVNQFINLVNGITLCNPIGRHIYNPRFLPYYNNTDWIPLSNIIDIDHLNKILASLKFTTRIITEESVGQEKWIKSNRYNKVCSTDSRIQILEVLSEEKNKYVDIGDVFSASLEKDSHIDKFELEFFRNIKFVSQFQVALNYIQDNYLGQKYNVVHLRLEDDFVAPFSSLFRKYSYQEYTMILMNRYLEHMDKMFSPDDKIYIATHLSKSHYENNYVIDLIREKYPNIIISVPWREHVSLPLGREVDAIVDFMIGRNALNFIGMHGSTFSILISKVNQARGKKSEIVSLFV